MKKVIIIVSIVLIIIGGYLTYRGISGSEESPYSVFEVIRGEIIQKVSVTGTVISAKEIDLEFEKSGKIRRIEVRVGDEVSAGQILVRLDTAELNAQLLASQAALEIARAKLSQVLAGSRTEDIQVYRSAVEKAEVEVQNKKQALVDAQAKAENNLIEAYQDALDDVSKAYTEGDESMLLAVEMKEDYFSGSSQLALEVKEKVKEGAESLLIAKSYLDAAKANPINSNIDLALDKMKAALDDIREVLAALRSGIDEPEVESSVSSTDRTNLDTQRSSIDTEIVNLTSAKQLINSTKIANQTSINEAQSNLSEAKAALAKARDELALKEAGPRQEDIDLAKAEVRQAEANVSQILAKINNSFLRAPVDGVITSIEGEEGETVKANSLIVSMISKGNFQVEANVSETEIAKVNLGDKVEMTLDALGPEEEFDGQIIKIDPAETVISGVIYYQVNSVFDAEDERIKPGMTVNLDIITDKKDNVLQLPFFAIKEINSEKKAQVLKDDGRIEERIIKTGLQGETNVEIIEGLKEGERVVVEK
jgi:HlyD family secretion protein